MTKTDELMYLSGLDYTTSRYNDLRAAIEQALVWSDVVDEIRRHLLAGATVRANGPRVLELMPDGSIFGGMRIDYVTQPQPEPSLSQQMLAAGYAPRDRKETCDECGEKVSPQMMPLHECEAQPEPVRHYPLPDSLYAGSKDWASSDYAGRVEWLHLMYESARAEADMWCDRCQPQPNV